MESAADVVAHAAERHRAQRHEHHVARLARRRSARARAAGTAARSGAETSARRRTRRGDGRRRRRTPRPRDRARRRAGSGSRPPCDRSPRSRSTMVAADCSTLSRSSRQTRAISSRTSTKPGLPHLRRRREVGAAVERLQRRRQPHAHRPAAGPGRHLDEGHVDAIDVRPLFAIDLDRHEVPVEHVGDLAALEALVLHHVAPVARRVADRQEDRLVLAARLLEGLVAPRVPVNGIVFVLEEVRTLFGGETVWHSSDYDRSLPAREAARHLAAACALIDLELAAVAAPAAMRGHLGPEAP